MKNELYTERNIQKELAGKRRRFMKQEKHERKGLTDPNSVEWNQHRFVALRKMLNRQKQGDKPSLSSKHIKTLTNYTIETEHDKYINYLRSDLGLSTSDAIYALNKIGPFYSLIKYARDISLKGASFREVIDTISKKGIFEEDLYQEPSIISEKEETQETHRSLGYLIAKDCPETLAKYPWLVDMLFPENKTLEIPFTDLPKEARERYITLLWGSGFEDKNEDEPEQKFDLF